MNMTTFHTSIHARLICHGNFTGTMLEKIRFYLGTVTPPRLNPSSVHTGSRMEKFMAHSLKAVQLMKIRL